MEELAPLLDSSAERPGSEQAAGTSWSLCSNRPCPVREKTSQAGSLRRTPGRLLRVPRSECPGHKQARGTLTEFE